MKLLFETSDNFDEKVRVQRVELVAEKFVDEQFLAALGRIIETGGGHLVAVGGNLHAACSFKVKKRRRRK